MRLPRTTDLSRLEQLSAAAQQAARALWIESVEELLGVITATTGSSERSDRSDASDRSDTSDRPDTSTATTLAPGLSLPGEVRRLGASLLGETVAGPLLKPTPGGALGCRVLPDQLERYAAQGRLSAARKEPPTGFRRNLPPSVRLMGRLLPVKDQGRRGTCVAFGANALREFLAGGATPLSEQFLYWACKELDGVNEPGTYLHTAVSALARYGVCPRDLWPYNPHPRPGNEGQGPPPDEALPAALEFLMPNARTVEPQLADHYREMLAGTDEVEGMPVVVGTLVFNSWYFSPEAHRTGKITLPLPGEAPIGGHAWCVVGYVDDPSVPGGGYFIVRNSWSARWAPDSPEAPGHALIPYAYIERCALEAFTGPAEALMANPETARRLATSLSDPAMDAFAWTLPSEARDLHQALHPAGTKVLTDPLEPNLFLPDGPAQRQAFLQRDCTWSDRTRRRLWFPPVPAAEAESENRQAAVSVARQQALTALDANLRGAVGSADPLLELGRWRKWLLPFDLAPKVRQATLLEDLSPRLVDLLQRDAGVPTDLDWPEPWRNYVADRSFLRVYEIGGAGRLSHVLIGFCQRLRFKRADAVSRPGSGASEEPRGCARQSVADRGAESPSALLRAQPRTLSATQPQCDGFSFPAIDGLWLDQIIELYRQWQAESGRGPRPKHVFLSLTIAVRLPSDLVWRREQGLWAICCRRLAPGSPLPGDPPAVLCEVPDEQHRFRPAWPEQRDFLDRLKPESDEERRGRVRRWADFIAEVEGGQPTLQKIVEKTGYRRSVVERAALALQEDGDYRLQELAKPGVPKHERVVLRRASKAAPVSIKSSFFNPRFLQRHALRIGAVALTVGINYFANWLQRHFAHQGWISAVGWIASLLVIYIGSRIQADINRRADRDKD